MIEVFYLALLNFYSVKNLLRWASSSISGGLASCVSSFCLYPIDNVKTRLQVVQKNNDSNLAKKNYDKIDSNDANLAKKNDDKIDSKFSKTDNISYIEMVKKVYQLEGISGFYKGLSACLLANFISFGCYFYWYEFFKIFFAGYSTYYGFTSTVSFFAGIVATTMVNPFWVINARMAISKTKEGFYQTFASGLKNEGIYILWKGVLPSYILVINPIIQFTIYENLKAAFEGSKYLSPIVFLSGMISKIAASFATYPYQVIRTNMHVSKEKTGPIETLKTIYNSRGFVGFYKGHGAKLFQTALNSGIMLLVYEKIKVLTNYFLERLFQ